MKRLAVLLTVLLAACASAPPPAPAEEIYGVAELQADVKDLLPEVKGPWVRRFLEAAKDLPSIQPRTIYHPADKSRAFTADELARLPEPERAGLEAKVFDETYYYTTRYGTPLAYTRPYEILAAAGLEDVAGKRVLDFGYGMIGQLRMLASIGAQVVGIEVDEISRALYSFPGDQGAIGQGSLRLVHGFWPANNDVKESVGHDFDLFISKNVLKRGYIHPAEPVDPKKLVQLDMTDEEFLAVLRDTVKPGGWVMIYNICPPPNEPGQPYIPWADGRSPFSEEDWKQAGFELIAYNQNDDGPMRAMAKKLDWGPDVDVSFFAQYTLARRMAQ